MKLILIRDFKVVRIIQREWPASSYIKIKYAQKREISGWKTAKLSFRRARNATNRTQEVRYAFMRTPYPQYAKSQ